ncbi:hypothetical protein DPMN_162339 [Dreissena polymorpha]|uniref:Uncharacterized protein n=1 Tax=Dreissena polymorpha TaxID=45954 RepID=A0A9D4IRX4_DREPO|nr:hypothetical protein DPMN_162339 [Dreissena polymorpha]
MLFNYQTGTIFKLNSHINRLSTAFPQKTRAKAPLWVQGKDLINILTKFHKDWMKTVTSIVDTNWRKPTNRPTNRPTNQQTGQKQYVPHYYRGYNRGYDGFWGGAWVVVAAIV